MCLFATFLPARSGEHKVTHKYSGRTIHFLVFCHPSLVCSQDFKSASRLAEGRKLQFKEIAAGLLLTVLSDLPSGYF